jgi:DNA-binding PadR family transcriptional regulator
VNAQPVTKRGAELERLILARLQRGPCAMATLLLTLRGSHNGVRLALHRLLRRGLVVGRCETRHHGYPLRTWALTPAWQERET